MLCQIDLIYIGLRGHPKTMLTIFPPILTTYTANIYISSTTAVRLNSCQCYDCR